MSTVHVADMTTIATSPAPTTTSDFVPVGPIRHHLLDLIDSGLDRAKIASLSKVSSREISSIIALARGGAPQRRSVPTTIAEQLLLVRTSTVGLDPATRVLALGARRRVQALAVMGWSLPMIASWMRADIALLEKLLDESTRAVTVRAHRAIAKMFTDHWMTPPTSKDAATVERAAAAGWQGPLAWDDFDLDLAPAVTALRTVDREETIDEVAIDLALTGTHVTLSATERRIVVARAHALHLGDNAISALTGIPLTTTWNIRTELGLPSWADEDADVQAVAA